MSAYYARKGLMLDVRTYPDWRKPCISKGSDHFLLFALFPRLFSHYAHHFRPFLGTYLWLRDPSLKSDRFHHFSSLIPLIPT